MRVVEYGEIGPPLVYLPTSQGDETEFERYGLPEALAPWIDAGRVRVFSIDGRGPLGLFDDDLPPPERMRAYAALERYVGQELLPWVAARSGAAAFSVAGASYGAFVAANLLFKLPGRVQLACGLGGVYGLWHRLEGHHDETVYFHTPLEYLPRLEDQALLGAIRRTAGLVLYAAEGDEWLGSSLRMVEVLRHQRLPHRLEIWPAPASHHESCWSEQIHDFLSLYF